MKSTNLFNITRFGYLIRQNAIHNYKLIALSVAGFCGGLFLIFFLMHSSVHFRPLNPEPIYATFMFAFFGGGIICAGTAFPGLRTREKSYSLLLNPASTLEKYVFEYLARIILFIIAMPIVFWITYNIEGYFARLVYPGSHFASLSLSDLPKIDGKGEELARWIYLLITSMIFLVFNISFTGTTIFMKYPLLKTLFGLGVVIFFHVALVFLFMEILHFKDHVHHKVAILFLEDEKDVLRFFTIYSLLINMALIAVSYLKLKEKEV